VGWAVGAHPIHMWQHMVRGEQDLDK